MASLFLGFVAAVLVALIANQIDASLPSIARWIVRHQARKMGPRAVRAEEEWLAHLDETPGGLGKLVVAIGTLVVPLRTIETSVAWSAWLVYCLWILVPLVAVATMYPPQQDRMASYSIVALALVVSGLFVPARLRAALATCYDHLSYYSRVCLGGAAVPVIGFIVIAWTTIVTTPNPLETTVAYTRASHEPRLVFLQANAAEFGRSDARVSEAPVRVRVLPIQPAPIPPEQPSLANFNVLDGDSRLPAPDALPLSVLVGVPALSLPEQPIPSREGYPTAGPPPAPMNLRLVSFAPPR